MKSEPDQFGIADLARVKREPWTGVRSYFARTHMRAMSVGDAVLFHHSNATPPGVAGTARVVRTGVVDETQFDPESPYHDPKATRDAPIWDCVEVEYVSTLPHFVSMDRIRAEPALADMLLLRRGMRLSVQPVTEAEYDAIVGLGHIAPREPAAKPKPPKPTRAAKPAQPKRAKPSKASKPSKPSKPPRSSVRTSVGKPSAGGARRRSTRRPGSSGRRGSAANRARP